MFMPSQDIRDCTEGCSKIGGRPLTMDQISDEELCDTRNIVGRLLIGVSDVFASNRTVTQPTCDVSTTSPVYHRALNLKSGSSLVPPPATPIFILLRKLSDSDY